MKKKVILNIQSVYTANAFFSGGKAYIGAGSETTSQVYLHELEKSESSLVDDCPGGVMSFVPVPGQPNLFYSIMGLFPPFVGLEAGVFRHRRGSLTLEVIKAVDFAKGEFSREAIEQDAGPTQTQVFTAAGVDYILSANQLKNEVVLYTE